MTVVHYIGLIVVFLAIVAVIIDSIIIGQKAKAGQAIVDAHNLAMLDSDYRDAFERADREYPGVAP